ncbi:homeobox-DDT domain protein RLT3 [Humulus lupulus]|uniref:homeobox-DDT domain protein RLT3 n=1 Tax=Humulus lupulus TaxID=3486 RepID=UPI002B403037|nr:homeobox-DDT domain protein RLT3 [Humulus lupulus]XP_062091462.1 homeobox-DDT domain protein RLT3 [Humulus lupulus]
MMETKRKTPVQLEALDSMYLENKYPTQMEIENYATTVGLTSKQIQCWFVEKRRKEKRENVITVSSDSTSTEKHAARSRSSSSKHQKASVAKNIISQDLFAPEYILKRVFRKDGPPLGVEFDSLPSGKLFHCKDPEILYSSCKESQRATKRTKVSKHAVINTICNGNNAPSKKHGMGKGLMTAWRAINPHAGDNPTSIDCANEETGPSISKSGSQNPQIQVRKPKKQKILTIQGRLRNKLQEKKKKHSVKRREVESFKDANQKPAGKTKCDLALRGGHSQENFNLISMLMDDEELEGRELQAVSNRPGCSGHFTTGLQDLLVKFPPNSVKMKQPFSMQPWDSSPEIVKKLFKVFHFLYTYSLVIDVCPFTLDEFAQAFHDKDSLLLGKIHVALLKHLLSDIEVELNNESLPHQSKSCNYLALLHMVENQDFSLEFWARSLNPLTWTEILRQILVASGFGSKQSSIRRETNNKEVHLMVKYGLRPATLKGALFRILLEQGNNGLKVSDMAKSFPIVDLKLAGTTEELECLICSMLSSDITLFEKISPTTYRLRINSILKKVEELQSDTEDSGAVDDGLSESDAYSSDEDSRCDAEDSTLIEVKKLNNQKNQNGLLNYYTEIDESHTGESWLLGLMEGEYSDLSIEEKLNVLVALIDLLREGSSIRIEEPPKTIAECVPSIHYTSSGGKIKRSSAKRQNLLVSSWGHLGQLQGIKEAYAYWNYHAIDSSASISKFYERPYKEKDAKDIEMWVGLHPMQSVFLGSDRRYNRYWLFLGPCDANDPGHRRVYFESSEDGHWEVIDTKEALCALLEVLDDRGKREALLIESLEKRQACLCETMSSGMVNSNVSGHLTQSDLTIIREDSYSPLSDVENNLTLTDVMCDSLPSSGAIVIDVRNKGEEQKQKWIRLQAFDSWIWSKFYLCLNAVKHGKRSYFDSLTRCECCHDLFWRDEKHCRLCHTTFEVDFDQEERYAIHIATCRDNEVTDMFPKVLSSQLQSLKAAIYAIESVMPEDALIGAWTKSAHKLWVKRLRRTSSLQELMQVLTDFIGAIHENWLCQCNVLPGSYDGEEIIACFTTLPQTTSAVALWLVKLDALVTPSKERGHSGKIANYQK